MNAIDVDSLFRLDGKSVILTGASSGLGERFARVLVAAGANVVAAARRLDRLEELAAELGTDRVAPAQADVTDDAAAAELCERCLAEFGSIDVVVNNAGISRVLPALDDDINEFRREIELDLVAPYQLSRTAARHMIQAGTAGSIISTGSVLGFTSGGGRLKVPGYAAAKGGLHNLTRELAAQWARKGIRVNAVCPGWFESEMTDAMFNTDSGRAFIDGGTLMGRAGRANELDGALLYLASEASSYVTGQMLFVDGGWTAH